MQDECSPNIGPTCDDGTTCEPSRPSPLTSGDAISSAADSPARTSATPESGQASTESEAVCGQSTSGWFARYDLATCLWRTSQLCLDGAWEEFSATWPRAGMTRNGTAYQRRTLAPRLSGREYSFWPRPRKNDFQPICWDRARRYLSGQWHRKRGGMANLNDRIGVWVIRNFLPDLKTKAGHDAYKATHTLPVVNVEFVERLMGFPAGWTELDASETP